MHWQAPTTIILSYAASLAFAIGHHLFYASLDQLSVDENLFDQQTNIAIGTAFAFLFRANLVLATCTAYWQVFWATALRNTLTISSMDALAGVLGSLLDFVSVKTFFLNPGLAVLALLAWVVPFASLLPPATLSVISAATTNNTYARVPVPYFADVNMAAFNYHFLAGDKFSGVEGGLESTMVEIYLKPTLKISRLATTTAYQGAVPDHRTAYPNSTYEVQFIAPLCGDSTNLQAAILFDMLLVLSRTVHKAIPTLHGCLIDHPWCLLAMTPSVRGCYHWMLRWNGSVPTQSTVRITWDLIRAVPRVFLSQRGA
jgi:hypothetical protein